MVSCVILFRTPTGQVAAVWDSQNPVFLLEFDNRDDAIAAAIAGKLDEPYQIVELDEL